MDLTKHDTISFTASNKHITINIVPLKILLVFCTVISLSIGIPFTFGWVLNQLGLAIIYSSNAHPWETTFITGLFPIAAVLITYAAIHEIMNHIEITTADDV